MELDRATLATLMLTIFQFYVSEIYLSIYEPITEIQLREQLFYTVHMILPFLFIIIFGRLP